MMEDYIKKSYFDSEFESIRNEYNISSCYRKIYCDNNNGCTC